MIHQVAQRDNFLRFDLKNTSGITLSPFGDMRRKENRRYIQDILNTDRIYLGRQIHSANIRIVEGKEEEVFFDDTDGLITFKRGIALGVLVADCFPVLFEGEDFVAILHCGYKGIRNGIIEKFFKLLKEMKVEYKNISSLIGPGICGKHYWIDLKRIILGKLELEGVKNIIDSGVCTFEDKRFFSYRREGENTGRNLAVILFDSS